MTAEWKVKTKWPDAFALNDDGLWSIRHPQYFGRVVELMPLVDDDPEFASEAEAWEDAAQRIDRGGER